MCKAELAIYWCTILVIVNGWWITLNVAQLLHHLSQVHNLHNLLLLSIHYRRITNLEATVKPNTKVFIDTQY